MIPSSTPVRPIIALLTDFGSEDGYVGTMKGVIAGIAPERVVNGAWVLATAYRYFPVGAVFVCVVDPGVGSMRRAVALHAGEWYFVGPDNGLFHFILAEQPVHQAVLLTNAAYHLRQVSATFHGRDIFAPAGAHLAHSTGQALPDLGTAVDPATLQRLDIAPPVQNGDTIEGRIIHVDHFGNLITSVPLAMVPDLFDLPQVKALIAGPGSARTVQQRRRFFAGSEQEEAKEEPFIYGDSSGYIAIAIQNGNAAQALGVGYGASFVLVTSTR
jgi:S-adenosylmethionine hydrolase